MSFQEQIEDMHKNCMDAEAKFPDETARKKELDTIKKKWAFIMGCSEGTINQCTNVAKFDNACWVELSKYFKGDHLVSKKTKSGKPSKKKTVQTVGGFHYLKMLLPKERIKVVKEVNAQRLKPGKVKDHCQNIKGERLLKDWLVSVMKEKSWRELLSKYPTQLSNDNTIAAGVRDLLAANKIGYEGIEVSKLKVGNHMKAIQTELLQAKDREAIQEKVWNVVEVRCSREDA
jgi:hypothetical protein